MTTATRPALLQLLLLLVLPVIWALHFAFIKKIGADTDALAALTALLAAVCALYFGVLALKRQLFVFTRSRSIFFLVAGVLAYVVPLAAEMLAAPKIDAAVLTMIVSLTPVFTVAVAMGLRLIRPALRLILSVIVGTIGILLLLLESNTSVESPTIWIIIACLVPMAYALDALYVEHFWPEGLNALQVAFGESFVSLLILLTVAILAGVPGAAIGGWFLQIDFLILCVVTCIEVALFFYLVSTAGAVMVNVASFLVLPAGFFWGWLIFDEVITIAGFGCVICAVTALQLARNYARE